ncbi:MAG TPA: histidine triad nucleotide-binding protein [Candidatus Limnocylindrales bacterium]|nr:histidine triad nucleotide-binding protein [Candidatus Limnocylindrales bacterium]
MADRDPDCLFCKIVAGEIPADIVQRDEHVIAFRDISPKAPTHVLLIPRRHVKSAAELGDEDGAMLGRLFLVAAQIAREAGLDGRGYRLVTNVGADAGQSVHHLHFHLLGGRTLRWPPG